MMILAIALSAVLIVIAAIHLLWALGCWFPLRDEFALVRAAVGFRGADRMPGAIPCALVTLALVTVATAIWWPDGWLRNAILWCAAGVFLIRGGLSRVPFWRRVTPQEPFASYDRRYYGPLCLALAAGLVVLQLWA